MPASLVTVFVFEFVDVWVAVTITPGTAAPEGSVAVPVMVAKVVCPCSRIANNTATTVRNRTIFLTSPSLSGSVCRNHNRIIRKQRCSISADLGDFGPPDGD